MGEWISVKDRLPSKDIPEPVMPNGRYRLVNLTETTVHCIVVYERDNGSRFVTDMYFDYRKNEFRGVTDDSHSHITHWQPLPLAPKNKDK